MILFLRMNGLRLIQQKKIFAIKKIDFRKDKGLVDIESACIILEQYLSRIK